MRMGVAAKLLLISFDSTLRSNLSVGMPIDLLIYRKDDYEIREQRRIEERDPVFPQDLRTAGRRRCATPSPISTNMTARRRSPEHQKRPPVALVEPDDEQGQATAGWFDRADP